MKNKKMFLSLLAFVSLLAVGCGETKPSTTTSGPSGDTPPSETVSYHDIAPSFTTEGKTYKLNEDGSLKEEITLPVLDNINYEYTESNGVATFTHASGYKASFLLKDDTIQIGSNSYNNVTCNFAGIEGLQISYSVDRFFINVLESTEATVASITGNVIEFNGKGTLNSGKIKVENIIVNDGPTINVNVDGTYGLEVNNGMLKPNSKVNVNVKNSNGVSIKGELSAFGALYVKNLSESRPLAGVEFVGTASRFHIDYTSRNVIEEFVWGVYVDTTTGHAGKISRPAGASWDYDSVTGLVVDGAEKKAPGQGDAALPYSGTDKDGNKNYLLFTRHCTYRWNCSDTTRN